MTIGLVLPNTPNYSETFFTNKINGLQKNGYTVILYVRETRENFGLCKIKKMPQVYDNKLLFFFQTLIIAISLIPYVNRVMRFYKLEKTTGTTVKNILKRIFLNSHLLKAKVDWLHFGFATQAIGSEHVANAIKAKMAVSFRGFDINVYPLKHPGCYEKLWKNVDKVHSISTYLLKEAYNLGLDVKTPYKIITPAIDLDVFNSIESVSEQNENRNITICTIARLNWIKNITAALHTIALLFKKYPKIQYQIIGGGSQKEKERYKFLAAQLGINDNVQFYDKLSHRETLQKLISADIYLQTSHNEGFCNAVLEAQALGCLTIASDVGGLKENIEDGKTGWLVYPIDASAFASKIIEVIQMTDKDKSEIRKAAKMRAQNDFNTAIQIKNFVNFYKT